MSEKLRIGEIARRTGRSIHTIRWYEAQGLIPGVARNGGRRRIYTEFHVGWLDLMQRLRLTGMSVAQMREYTALAKIGDRALIRRRALLASHRARAEETIMRWTDALALIDAKIDFYDEWLASGERPTIEPHRRVRKPMTRASRAKLRLSGS